MQFLVSYQWQAGMGADGFGHTRLTINDKPPLKFSTITEMREWVQEYLHNAGHAAPVSVVILNVLELGDEA